MASIEAAVSDPWRATVAAPPSPPASLTEIPLPSLSIARFAPLVGAELAATLGAAATRARRLLSGRALWHVSATAAGGGVAEILRSLLGYARGAEIDTRWLTIEGDAAFFTTTTRVHHGLHGSPGDGGPLGASEQEHYADVLARNASALRQRIGAGDVVVLHDPGTAGLVAPLKRAGATVIWRCHVGHDTSSLTVERTWQFLRPHLAETDAYVFSRLEYVPPWLAGRRVSIIPPSIDVLAPKNLPLSVASVRAILGHIGILAQGGPGRTRTAFLRADGTTGRVERTARIVRAGALPLPEAPLVVQVSRWDRLKDMRGVMEGFAATVAHGSEATLALVGPDVHAAAGDPEGIAVFNECVDAWQALPRRAREQILLVLLPVEDADENAVMVNAIQRHATVVVQKSLGEGFGLPVTEAMWKGRAIVASAVGGIREQIAHETHGLLLDDPTDRTAFGAAVDRLLADPGLARRLGRNAQRRCQARFLGPRHLLQFVDLIADVFARRAH
jgi:trehalose synthase